MHWVKDYNEEIGEEYLLEVDLQYPQIYMIFIIIYHYYQKEWRLKRLKSL